MDGDRVNKRKRDDDGAGTPGSPKMARASEHVISSSTAEAAEAPIWEAAEPPEEGGEMDMDPVSASTAMGNERRGLPVAPSHGDRFKNLDHITTIPKVAGGDWCLVGSPAFAGGDVPSPSPIGIGQPAARVNISATGIVRGLVCPHCSVGALTLGVSPVDHLCLCNFCRTNVNAGCPMCGLRGG